METFKKIYSGELKSLNETDKTVVGVISSKTIDRDGDIILPEKINDTNYSKNPIVLFNHNYSMPIGKSLWRKVEGDNYISKTQFGNTTLAQEVFSLMKDGILRAFSVGFMSMDKSTYENDVRTFGNIELLEYSVVSVPANPSAITLSFVKSLESPELTSIYFKDYIIENMQEEMNLIKSQLSGLLNFEEKAMNGLNSAGFTHAKSLVSNGNVIAPGSWNPPTAAEENSYIENNGWSAYSRWFLGTDSNATDETKAKYGYIFTSDFKNVDRNGVIAIKQRAAAQNLTSVYNAADTLLTSIDEKSLTEMIDKRIMDIIENAGLIKTKKEAKITADDVKRILQQKLNIKL